MGVEKSFVFVVPVLGTDSDRNGFVGEAVLDDGAEELVTVACYFSDSRAGRAQ